MSFTNISEYPKRLTLLLSGFALLTMLLFGSGVVAAAPASSKTGSKTSGTKCDPVSDATCARCAANADGSVPDGCPKCDGTTCDPAASPKARCDNKQCDFIGKYINPAINLLSAVFGFVAVISIILGGIQYSSAGGDPQKVTQAKQRISKTIVAVLAYMFLYSFLQFIIPGGIFK